MKKRLTGLAVAALVAGVVGDARAGSYQVRGCGPTGAAGPLVAREDPLGTLRVAAQCPPVGQPLTGVFVTTTAANSPRGAQASWQLTAPAGTTINHLAVNRSLGKRDPDWFVAITADGQTLETCSFVVGQAGSCSLGTGSSPTLSQFPGLRAQAVSFIVQCRDAVHQCAGRETPTQAWIAVYDVTATINDPDPPTLSFASKAPIAPGWEPQMVSFDVSAADATGVGSLALNIPGVSFTQRPQPCDYSRMQPCPAGARETFTVDTARLPDGTYPVVATAADAAGQPATASATLRVDQHAPGAPQNLKAELAEDGTYGLTWTNPTQGTAAPIVRAHYQVCDALGVACSAGVASAVQRADSLGISAGDHQVRVWLEDEAGHADPASAAVIHVNSSTGAHVVETNPPVLLPSGAGASPQLRVTRTRRDGSTLVLSGTIAKRASARITAQVSRTRTGRPVASARATPRNGRWTIRVKLGPSLQRSSAIYLTLRFAGQGDRYRTMTLRRRLARG